MSERGVSDEVALMQLLLRFEDLDAVRAEVAGSPRLAALLAANEAGCARICAMLRSGVDPGGETAASIDEGLAATRRLFDWSVGQDEAASVALYSLGNPAILARATDEILAWLDGRGALAERVRVLELGCGTGRLLPGLATRTARVVGVDVAPRMIEAAARRCAGLARVELRTIDGRDLRGFEDASFDLVLAVDSFPYVVQAGEALVAALFAEVRRVLASGGSFALCNYSYRGDDARDRAEVAGRARAVGLAVRVNGERPFAVWDGLVFWLARAPAV